MQSLPSGRAHARFKIDVLWTSKATKSRCSAHLLDQSSVASQSGHTSGELYGRGPPNKIGPGFRASARGHIKYEWAA
jgi:hypothetical protein